MLPWVRSVAMVSLPECERALERCAQRNGIRSAPARGHMLVRTDQVNGAGPGVIALGGLAEGIAEHARADAPDRDRHRTFRERCNAVGGGVAERQCREALLELPQQPAPRAVRPYNRCVGRRAAGTQCRRECISIGRIERGAVECGRSREPTAVDEAACEGIALREAECGVPESAARGGL